MPEPTSQVAEVEAAQRIGLPTPYFAGSHSAYVPDLTGSTSCGDTIEELRENIKEAVAFRIEGMEAAGVHVPLPTSQAAKVKAA